MRVKLRFHYRWKAGRIVCQGGSAIAALAELKIANHKIHAFEREVDPLVMTLFRESDKCETTVEEHSGTEEDDDSWDYSIRLEYRSTAKDIIDRLDVMGFSLERAQQDYERGADRFLREDGWNASDFGLLGLKELSFKTWLFSMREIVRKNLSPWTREDPVTLAEPAEIQFILVEAGVQSSLTFWGFPCSDIRYALRAILSVYDEKATVVLDYTDLSDQVYLGADVPLSHLALQSLIEPAIVNDRILILTEGSSDGVILQETLHALFPHLQEYYSFADFYVSNIPGGAGPLVNIVKAFISAGIRSRAVAVFDNDTAATVALKGLNRVQIPENIKIVRLPALKFARNYPTIGPQGTVPVDINGLACSIELYLGVDILKDQTGELVPVQWKGYDETIQQYQGEVLHKDGLRAKYLRFLVEAKGDCARSKSHDWEPMRAVLATIFNAFKR